MSEGADDLLSSASADAADADERNAFRVDLDGYEGPLHLLLDLARRQKVDLTHISILELANQYLAFIRDAQDRRMDLAADYLLMAAWLAYLKSKLLLPSDKPSEDEVDGEGLAARLAFRLKRLEAMRRAGADLQNGLIDGRDVFRRGAPESARILRKPIWQASLYEVLKAFGDINVRKFKQRKHVVKRQPVLALDTARQKLKSLIPELTEWTAVQSLTVTAAEAPDAPKRSVTASFFSAALELTRDNVVDLRQDRHFADVYVRKHVDLKAAE